jgi:hypothetical protein
MAPGSRAAAAFTNNLIDKRPREVPVAGFRPIRSPEELTVRSLAITPARVRLKVDCELRYKDAAGVFQPVKTFTIERAGNVQFGPIKFGPVAEAFRKSRRRSFA